MHFKKNHFASAVMMKCRRLFGAALSAPRAVALTLRRRQLLLRMSMLFPRTIAARLYGLSVLTIGALITISIIAFLYVQQTEQVLTDSRDHDVALATSSADIEILIERHRRIIGSALGQRDATATSRIRRSSDELAKQITAVVAQSNDPQLVAITAQQDSLTSAGRKVVDLPAQATQAQISDAVEAYNTSADKLQNTVHDIRLNSLNAAQNNFADLLKRGQTLQLDILFAGLLALLVVAPLSALIIRSVVGRIKSVAEGMQQIAITNTPSKIASYDDNDEIGEMARALNVFRSTATVLLSNSHENKRLNAWLQIALNNMARGLSMFDSDGNLLVCNKRYLELYGLPEKCGQPGTPFNGICDHWCEQFDGEDRAAAKSWFAKLRKHISLGVPFTEAHTIADGRTILVNTQPLDGGGWVDLHEDITEKRAAEAQIAQLAHFDTLTGLANRHFFQETLDDALTGLDQVPPFALLWLDLDRFKAVNDTLGHPAGDELLRIVAERLRSCVRATDFIARLGGDEFAIIAPTAGDTSKAATIISDRILRKLSTPYDIAGKMVSVGVTIGIALAPDHGSTAEDLIHNADIALYRAKTHGRGQHSIFNHNMEAQITLRDTAEADLRRALTSNELLLHYQPILSLETGRVTVCEALMRWKHPTRGMVSPAEFIPLAEEVGLIGAMGDWALRQACRDAAQWPNGIKVSVNVAATQFTTSDVVVAVKSALQLSGLSANRLELEVTETVMLKDNAATLEALQELRGLGVNIALDDFGTGYASLSYLRSFPFDKIKIDQCFVKDIATRNDCFSIVQAIVSLASSLGMASVAEGIETVENLQKVIAAGCDEAQGYYFSRPVAAADLAAAFNAAEQLQAQAA